jgi:hypothetical protein
MPAARDRFLIRRIIDCSIKRDSLLSRILQTEKKRKKEEECVHRKMKEERRRKRKG